MLWASVTFLAKEAGSPMNGMDGLYHGSYQRHMAGLLGDKAIGS